VGVISVKPSDALLGLVAPGSTPEARGTDPPQQTRTMNRYPRLLAPVRPLLHPPSSQRHLLPIVASTCALGPSTRWNRFSTSTPTRSTNFDTLKVAQRLEANGFTPEQSKAVMQLLKDVIDESIMGLTRTTVTREEQDKVPQTPNFRTFLRGGIDSRRRINKKSTLHN
jgi:Protein of unknown function (DUF1640)